MKLAGVVLLALLGLALADVTTYEGYKVYKLQASGPHQIALVNKLDGRPGYDFWSRKAVEGRPTTIMVSPEQQTIFETYMSRHGVALEVLIQDVETVFAKERAEVARETVPEGKISFTTYHSHAVINAYLMEIATNYPSVATHVNLGTSFEGRAINGLVLSSNPGANNPIVFVDAGIHAREWIAPPTALYIIQEVVENPANAAMLDGVDWHIFPLLNADGYEFSRTNTRMWRKTRSTVSSTTCPGVDPNRNFGWHWSEGGTSTNPCSDIFHGPNAFSESEAAALRDYLATVSSRTSIYLTIHSYGEMFLYPWSYSNPPTPSNNAELLRVGRGANTAQVAAGGNSYGVGMSFTEYGATAGSSDDWAMGGAGIPLSYTIECPGGGSAGFDMPPANIQATVTPLLEAFRWIGNDVMLRNKK